MVLHLRSVGLNINATDEVRVIRHRVFCESNICLQRCSASKPRCTWLASRATSPWQRTSSSNAVPSYQQTKLAFLTYVRACLIECFSKTFLKDGLTPLHSCVRSPQVVKYKELISLLIKHGVVVNAQTKVIGSPFMVISLIVIIILCFLWGECGGHMCSQYHPQSWALCI